ncbi:LssY C-terminal domain-containing protein [Streptomyces caniscabiei]|uniref:LssY C-terminal domain-containing protein n=1 Tax=Streptomyces caniscabiei TaxID=2746961 RepID=UPI0029B27FCD|nr:LssY C-terminal domain-containing protein [Streptomyces caniscabiei]MDX2776175.1 LssY C-terminal domain-containing protein [Streptomyces caniscabiei]
MIGTLWRLAWRVFVGGVAALLAYGTAFLFYPYLQDRLPLVVNLIILYVLTAYLVIPFLVRLWHLVLRPRHLPLYVTSGDGWSSDPVNIAIVCRSEKQLRRHMKQAGWSVADKVTPKTMVKMGWAVLFERPYPTAPFSSLYLFGRKQDIGFQIQTGTPTSPRHRHHVRFWQLEADPKELHEHTTFWQDIFQLFTAKKQQIWIGAATHDIGPFAFRVRNLQVTHQIDKETSRERDFIISTLRHAGVLKRHEVIPAGEPIKFRGQTFGVDIVTDGTLHVVELKK